MKSTITDLWYGNLPLCENCGAGDQEAEDLLRAMTQSEETLRSELGAAHKDLFLKYVRWSDEYACCISALAFQDGFPLACKLMCEALAQE